MEQNSEVNEKMTHLLMDVLHDRLFLTLLDQNKERLNVIDGRRDFHFRTHPIELLLDLVDDKGENGKLVYDALATIKTIRESFRPHRSMGPFAFASFMTPRGMPGFIDSDHNASASQQDYSDKVEKQLRSHLESISALLSKKPENERETFVRAMTLMREMRHNRPFDSGKKPSPTESMINEYLPDIKRVVEKEKICELFFNLVLQRARYFVNDFHQTMGQDSNPSDIDQVFTYLDKKFNTNSKAIVVDDLNSRGINVISPEILLNFAEIYPKMQTFGVVAPKIRDERLNIGTSELKTFKKSKTDAPATYQTLAQLLKNQQSDNPLCRVLLDLMEGFPSQPAEIETNIRSIMKNLTNPSNIPDPRNRKYEERTFGNLLGYIAQEGGKIHGELLRHWFGVGMLQIPDIKTRIELFELTEPADFSDRQLNRFFDAIGYAATQTDLSAHMPGIIQLMENPKLTFKNKLHLVETISVSVKNDSDQTNASLKLLGSKLFQIIGRMKSFELENGVCGRIKPFVIAGNLLRQIKNDGPHLMQELTEGFSWEEKANLTKRLIQRLEGEHDLPRQIVNGETSHYLHYVEASNAAFQLKPYSKTSYYLPELVEMIKKQFPRIGASFIKKMEAKQKSLEAEADHGAGEDGKPVKKVKKSSPSP